MATLPGLGRRFDQLIDSLAQEGEVALAFTLRAEGRPGPRRGFDPNSPFQAWAFKAHALAATLGWSVHGGWLPIEAAPSGPYQERITAAAVAFAETAEFRARAVLGVPEPTTGRGVYARMAATAGVKQGYSVGARAAGDAGGATHKVWIRIYPHRQHRDWHDVLEGRRIPRDDLYILPGGPNMGARVTGPHDWDRVPSAREWLNCGHAVVYVQGPTNAPAEPEPAPGVTVPTMPTVPRPPRPARPPRPPRPAVPVPAPTPVPAATPAPFDPAPLRQALVDLGASPDGQRVQRLVENAARTEAEFNAWRVAFPSAPYAEVAARVRLLTAARESAERASAELASRGRALLYVPEDQAPRLAPRYRTRDAAERATWEEGLESFQRLVGPRASLQGAPVELRLGGARSNHDAGVVTMARGAAAQVVVHELGHLLEFLDPGVLDAARAFYARRTAGEPLLSLRALTGLRYGASERARRDQFLNPYMGKWYAGAAGQQRATELVSMGLELLHADPIRLAQDADYFDWILATLRRS